MTSANAVGDKFRMFVRERSQLTSTWGGMVPNLIIVDRGWRSLEKVDVNSSKIISIFYHLIVNILIMLYV